MSSDIFDSSVHICRTTDLSDYSWSSLLTITFCSQSSSWLFSSWTRAFILVWASTLTSLSMNYKSIHERLQIDQVKNISEQMNKTLIFTHEALIKTRKQMMNQANKHRKKINYKIKSKMFLNERNIITARLFKKLNNKMLNSFQIINLVDSFYKLKLLKTMHIHNVFHSELLHLVVNDSLSDQKNEFSKSIVINDEDEWEINNILNFRWYQRQLQYQVKWKSYDNDLNWYNADNNEFMNAQNVVDDFHTQYFNRAH